MNPETQDRQAENPHEEGPPRAWFATFSFLDVSGAISSSQLWRVLAPVRNLMQKVFGKAFRPSQRKVERPKTDRR